MQAINNDVTFLASQSVMDYSLLVGLDETKSELVVGIIGKDTRILAIQFVSIIIYLIL